MPQTRLGKAKRLFTVGYEGRTLDGFIHLLEAEGIEQVVDVRENPWSRKPGFTIGPLADALEDAGIAYEHVGELGTPKPMREALREGKIESFEDAYLAHLDDQGDALDRLRTLADRAPTTVMCMEADPRECHRRFLARRLQREGWAVIHVDA